MYDTRKRIVCMNALLVHRLYLKAGNAFVLLQGKGDVPHEILDKDRVVIGLHRDVPLIRALQQRVEGSRRPFLGDGNEFLNPDEFPSVLRLPGPHLDGDDPPLVVSAVVAYLLGAGTKGLHGHLYPQSEAVFLAIGLAQESDLAADLGLGPADGGGLLNEVGEAHLDVGALGV